jgi:RNA polymerase sigma factor (sigma-70 family)
MIASEVFGYRVTLLPAAVQGILRAAGRRMGVRRKPASGSPQEGDDPLLARFLERDDEALVEIQETVTRVVRFRGYGVSAADQADLVQEAILHIWRESSRPDFAFRRDFGTFARLVAARRCLDWRRASRKGSRVSNAIPDTHTGPEEAALEEERVRLARQVLAETREPCRELIRLHVHESESYKLMAVRLGRSEGSLRTQMWECLKEARAIAERLRKPARVRAADGKWP